MHYEIQLSTHIFLESPPPFLLMSTALTCVSQIDQYDKADDRNESKTKNTHAGHVTGLTIYVEHQTSISHNYESLKRFQVESQIHEQVG